MLNKEQIARVDDAVSQVRKLLDDCEIPYETYTDEGNKNVHIFHSFVNGWQNTGLIGWNLSENKICFATFDNERVKQEEMEGFEQNKVVEIVHFADTLDMFFKFLSGEVREVLDEMRQEKLSGL